MSIDQRPDSPSPELLDRARTALAQRLSHDPTSLRWKIGGRQDRKRSTLFHLTLLSATAGPVATSYFKKAYFPEDRQGSSNLTRAREAILRSEDLGNRFAELSQGLGVMVNVTLAVDPEALEVITLGLEGKPLGNPLRFVATERGRRTALSMCSNVGRAIRIVEEMEDIHRADLPRDIWEKTDQRLVSVSPLMSDAELRWLRDALHTLYQAATEEDRGIVLAHGDLGPGNVIVMPVGTGLIDFMWMPQLRGFDLSRFVHRLRYTTPSYRPWVSALTDAMLEGYGDPAAPLRPGWRFSEMQRLLVTIQHLESKGEARRGVMGRALEQLRAGIAE